MISTRMLRGQGLGNQLWCYVSARVLAKDLGYDFGVADREAFKGNEFLELDFGAPVTGITQTYTERSMFHRLNGADVRNADPALAHVADNTEVIGLLQDEQAIAHRKDEIREWLRVKSSEDCHDFSSDNICIVNFRGSGYVVDKDLFLPKRYWTQAMDNMRKINPAMEFIVITEDVATARIFFPDLKVFHFSIGKDYSIVKNAHYLILSNSSFAWFPAWLSTELKYCIAPKYWARHNVSDGFWCLGYNITTGWMYQDRTGVLHDYASCQKEWGEYQNKNAAQLVRTFTPSVLQKIQEKIRVVRTLTKEFPIHHVLGNMISVLFFEITLAAKDRIQKYRRRVSSTRPSAVPQTGSSGSPTPAPAAAAPSASFLKKRFVLSSYY